MFLIKEGMSIPTGQPFIQEGSAQSKHLLASVCACSNVKPWFTSSNRVCERYSGSNSAIFTRGIAVRSLGFIALRNSSLQVAFLPSDVTTGCCSGSPNFCIS